MARTWGAAAGPRLGLRNWVLAQRRGEGRGEGERLWAGLPFASGPEREGGRKNRERPFLFSKGILKGGFCKNLNRF